MAAKATPALDPVADLKRRLARQPGELRTTVLRWWRDQALTDHPAAVGKRIAIALLEEPRTDAKLAGIIALHELLADHLRVSDLAVFVRLFDARCLTDRIVVDWFATFVLGTMLERVPGRGDVARTLALWRNAETMWQRRAACVGFTAIARDGDAGLTAHMLAICAVVVWSPERGDQSAVAALLRELSRAEPTRVEAFVRRHARFMSRHCARGAIDRLPAGLQKELLAHWKRATSLGR